MRHNYTFHRGIIDKDSDTRLVEPGKLLGMKNAIVEGGKVIKQKGMLDLGAVMETGYTIVGSKIYNDIVYVFSTNGSSGAIGKYDINTETYTLLIATTNLNFDINYPILDIDFIADEGNNRLLMYWVDGLSEPRYVNLTFLETNPTDFYTTASAFSVIKAPPRKEPSIVFLDIQNIGENGIINKCFRFAVRYVYADGQPTPISCFSRPGFVGERPYGEREIANAFNGIRITHEVYDYHHPQVDGVTSNSIVAVEFIAWEVNTNVMFRIAKFEEGITNGTVLTFDFFNNETYIALSNSSFLSYSNVPKIARNQWISENNIVYGDYDDGYSNDTTFDLGISTSNIDYFGNLVYGTIDPGDNQRLDFDPIAIGSISKNDILVFSLDFQPRTVSQTEWIFSFVAESDYPDIFDMFFNSPESQRYRDTLAKYNLFASSPALGVFSLIIGDTGSYLFAAQFLSVKKKWQESSLKYNTIYEYGILYMDDHNRRGDIELFPKTKTNGNSGSFGYEIIKPVVTINNSPPTWAKKFKIVRREYIYGFSTVRISTSDVYDGQIYLGLNEIYYDDVPDTAKSITISTISVDDYQLFAVINSIEITDATHPLGAGKFIVIGDNNYDGFTLDDVANSVDLFVRPSSFDINLGTNITTETFREYPETFFIENGYHVSEDVRDGDQNQTSTLPFIKELIFDGDILKVDLTDGYTIDVGKYYSPLGRAHLDSDDFKEQRRKASVTYSTDVYVQDSGKNGLSTFDLGQVNYKDYDIRYGQIQKIYGRDTDLVIFQEDKVHFQPFNKNLIQAVTGDGNIVASDKILGTHTSYVGEYGMSHPESFAFRDKILFWIDAKRGEVMRLDVNGLFPISHNGLRDYWHDFFKNTIPSNMYGCFDAKNLEYLVYNGIYVWAYSLEDQGWSRILEYQPELQISDGINTYSFKGLKLYKHYAGTINDYYGIIVDSEFQFAANKGFSDKKVAHAVYLEGDQWDMNIEDSEGRYTTINSYEDKEGFLYSGVPMIESVSASQGIGGIGVCSNISQGGGYISMDVTLTPDGLSIGDNIFTGNILIGNLIAVNGNTLYLFGTGVVVNGDFVYYKKNAKLEGAPMRDHLFILTMTHSGSDYADLFAIDIETVKSNS